MPIKFSTASRTISRASLDILRGVARDGVVQGVEELDDGRYRVELDADVAEALEGIDRDIDAAIASLVRRLH